MPKKNHKKDEPTRTVRRVTPEGVPTGPVYERYSREAVAESADLAWVIDAADHQDEDAYYVLAQRTDAGFEIPVPRKDQVVSDLQRIARRNPRRDDEKD